MFYKFIRFDLRNGICREYKKLIFIFSLHLVIGFVYCLVLIGAFRWDEAMRQEGASFADYIFYYISGISVYDIQSNRDFMFPAVWLFSLLTCCFSSLYYPFKDLQASGKHMLILSGSRSAWWSAKCIWLVASVLVYYVVAYLASFIAALLFGARLDLVVSGYAPHLIGAGAREMLSGPWNIGLYMLIVPLTVLALCSLQMLLSLILKPIISFIICAALLLAAAYYNSPFLVGGFAMVARSELFLKDGAPAFLAVVNSLGLILISFLTGFFKFRRKDVL